VTADRAERRRQPAVLAEEVDAEPRRRAIVVPHQGEVGRAVVCQVLAVRRRHRRQERRQQGLVVERRAG
jgi:hypothetical protein